MSRPRTYSGIIDVTDDAFSLVVEDLRIRTGENVAFIFRGEDRGGPFRCNGSAIYRNGFYVAGKVAIVATRLGTADIRFSKVVEMNEYCVIEGSWSQDGYEGSPWTFWGELDLNCADPG